MNPLRKMLLLNDLTIEQLASYLGVARSTIYNRMSGRADWPVADVWRVADFIGIEDVGTLRSCFPPRK